MHWHVGLGTSRIVFMCVPHVTQVLAEDAMQNRMQESLALFETILSYPWFQDSAIILFMNKTDLFMEKVGKSPISTHFPGYRGQFVGASPQHDSVHFLQMLSMK